ncbi:MAG: hypothetical protein J1E84_08325, partial [Muribaculaceae bacterium]|nr:hypothetical protein [Muribaculaceae bacterium]
ENIVLRQGVDYIYEYLFLCRNNYLHNRFDLKESSNNEDYVNWVEQQVTNSKKTVALLYMIPKTENGDYDYSPSMLQTMLENQLKPIVIRDQYVIYVRQ